MLRKAFVLFLVCCFFSSMFTMQALADTYRGELGARIAEFQAKQEQVKTFTELLDAYEDGTIELTEDELEDIRAEMLVILDETAQEIGRPEYQPYLQYIQKLSEKYLPEEYSLAISKIIGLSQMDGNIEERVSTMLVDLFICLILFGLISVPVLLLSNLLLTIGTSIPFLGIPLEILGFLLQLLYIGLGALQNICRIIIPF